MSIANQSLTLRRKIFRSQHGAFRLNQGVFAAPSNSISISSCGVAVKHGYGYQCWSTLSVNPGAFIR